MNLQPGETGTMDFNTYAIYTGIPVKRARIDPGVGTTKAMSNWKVKVNGTLEDGVSITRIAGLQEEMAIDISEGPAITEPLNKWKTALPSKDGINQTEEATRMRTGFQDIPRGDPGGNTVQKEQVLFPQSSPADEAMGRSSDHPGVTPGLPIGDVPENPNFVYLQVNRDQPVVVIKRNRHFNEQGV